MTTRLIVNPNTAHGKVACEAAAAVIAAQESLNRLKGAVDRMSTGNPADYAAVQAELGFQTLQAATDFVFLLSSATSAMNASILAEFAQRVDQG